MTLLHLLTAGVGRLRRPAFDARAAVELARLGLPFFPVSRYALAPSALLAVVNDVILNTRVNVLELGSGYSTICIAKALDETDGAITTVDADAGWLDKVVVRARKAGVADRIRPIHAPLKPLANSGEWYDVEPIRAACVDRKIDLLLVDGPVASGGADPRARAPAARALADLLAPDFSIFLDDIHRPSHAAIAREWGELLKLAFTLVHARGGYAYAARGRAFDPII